MCVAGHEVGARQSRPCATASTGDQDSLDGLAQVEPGMIEDFDLGDIGIALVEDVWARLTDLGGDFTAQVVEEEVPSDGGGGDDDGFGDCLSSGGGGGGGDPETVKVVDVDSEPETAAIELGGGIETAVPRLDFDCDGDNPLFEKEFTAPGFVHGFLKGRLRGHIAIPELRAGELSLRLTNLGDVQVRESPVASWAVPGIVGTYDELVVSVDDYLLQPDIDLTFDLDGGVSCFNPDPDVCFQTVLTVFVTADQASDTARFRLADQAHHPSECASFRVTIPAWPELANPINVTPEPLPGPIATGEGSIAIPSGGQYTLNVVPFDIGVDIDTAAADVIHEPDWALLAVDLAAGFATAPFRVPEPEVDWDPGIGPC